MQNNVLKDKLYIYIYINIDYIFLGWDKIIVHVEMNKPVVKLQAMIELLFSY